MQFDYDKVKDLVQINAIQADASIQNFGSAALKLTYSNYFLYDPACEIVNVRLSINVLFMGIFLSYDQITTVLVSKN